MLATPPDYSLRWMNHGHSHFQARADHLRPRSAGMRGRRAGGSASEDPAEEPKGNQGGGGAGAALLERRWLRIQFEGNARLRG